MSDFWLYAYLGMPFVILAMGYGAMLLARPRHHGPAE